MDETGEQKVKFIGDISEVFEHNVGNSLVPARTATELAESGRVFDESEDAEWLTELRSTRDRLLSSLEEILGSEFDESARYSKASITAFRDLVAGSDLGNPSDIRKVLDAYEALHTPLNSEVAEAKEQLQQQS